jgi:hypothetical protein
MQMNQAVAIEAREQKHKTPSIAGSLIFKFKTFGFQAVRVMRNISASARAERGHALTRARVLAQSSTPLSSSCDQREAPLVAGKIQNLRIAIREIDGLEIQPGQTFSFWTQLGRPSRRKGYARGRELRQGCLIPTVGGGLCQLSNALYQCALESGFEIIERHAHSQVVPGSAAEYGMDATVFWNYVDLRFRSRAAFRIEASLAGGRLIVRFKSAVSFKRAEPEQPVHRTLTLVRSSSTAQTPAPLTLPVMRSNPAGHSPSSCASCGVLSCFRNEEKEPKESSNGKTAYLVDEYWPEFDKFITSDRKAGDAIGIPLGGKLARRSRYRWNTSGFKTVGTANLVTLRRSFDMRHAPQQGAGRQRRLMKHDQRLARALGRLLTYDVSHVVVTQTLLPILWADGHLAERTFDVLMTRLPMDELQKRLDEAHDRHPESTTLGDFRAEQWLVDAESQALKSARRIITPHTGIAPLFGDRAVLLDWHMPKVAEANGPAPGSGVLFPASTLGRKGAYEVRDAARMLGLELTITGRELEGPGFWRGIPTRPAGENLLDGIGLVVLPAYIEDKPRLLLRAAACGIPVIASAACGLARVPGVVTLPGADSQVLAAEISSLVNAEMHQAPAVNRPHHLDLHGCEHTRQLAVSVGSTPTVRLRSTLSSIDSAPPKPQLMKLNNDRGA